jgi:hypothetical protein
LSNKTDWTRFWKFGGYTTRVLGMDDSKTIREYGGVSSGLFDENKRCMK